MTALRWAVWRCPTRHLTQLLTTEGLEACFSESFIIPIKKKISNTNKIKQRKRDILLPLYFLVFHLKTQNIALLSPAQIMCLFLSPYQTKPFKPKSPYASEMLFLVILH